MKTCLLHYKMKFLEGIDRDLSPEIFGEYWLFPMAAMYMREQYHDGMQWPVVGLDQQHCTEFKQYLMNLDYIDGIGHSRYELWQEDDHLFDILLPECRFEMSRVAKGFINLIMIHMPKEIPTSLHEGIMARLADHERNRDFNHDEIIIPRGKDNDDFTAYRISLCPEGMVEKVLAE